MKKLILPVVTALFAPLACDALLQDGYELSSPTSLPEGVAFDEGSSSFFATAINGGKITRVTPLGQEVVFYSDNTPNRSFSGAHVDASRRRLWVCVVDVASNPFPVSQVFGFNIDTRKRTHVIPLPTPSFCNDLVTDDHGILYATDSATPQVLRIDPKVGTPKVHAVVPIQVVNGAPGLNGIDISPDGEKLLVSSSFPAGLFSIPISDPEVVVAVEMSGDPYAMPGNPLFPAPDGVEFIGDQLYVAYDGGVQQLTFTNDEWSAASVKTTTAVPTGLTSLTEAEGELFAIDSEVFGVLYQQKAPQLPFRVLRVDAGLF